MGHYSEIFLTVVCNVSGLRVSAGLCYILSGHFKLFSPSSFVCVIAVYWWPPDIPSGPFTCVNLFIANATDVWSLWGAVVWEVATAKLVWKFFRQRLNSDWANVDMSYFRSELLLFLSFLSGKNACPPQAFISSSFGKFELRRSWKYFNTDYAVATF